MTSPGAGLSDRTPSLGLCEVALLFFPASDPPGLAVGDTAVVVDTNGEAFGRPVGLPVFAMRARGTIARLGATLDDLAKNLGGVEAFPDWLDEHGRLAVWARDVEEIPRLLVRLAGYLAKLPQQELPTELAARCEEYLSSYEDSEAQTLRNWIEHEADYLAGKGHETRPDIDLSGRIGFSYTIEPFELNGIEMLGHGFKLGSAVADAVSLYEPLTMVLV